MQINNMAPIRIQLLIRKLKMYPRQDIQGERIEHRITNIDCFHESICRGGRRDKEVGKK